MNIDRDIMLRLVRNELSGEEAERVTSMIDADPQLSAQLVQVRRLDGALAGSAADSFAPYFSDRVIKRLMAGAADVRSVFYDSLRWAFVRLAAASILVVIGLGAYNLVASQDDEITSSTIEAVFGVPSTDLDNLFYLQGI